MRGPPQYVRTVVIRGRERAVMNYQGCCQAGAAKGLALCLIHNGFSVNTVIMCPGLPKIGPVYDRCLVVNINCAHFTVKSIPGCTINNMGTLSVRVCRLKPAAYPQQSWINTTDSQSGLSSTSFFPLSTRSPPKPNGPSPGAV